MLNVAIKNVFSRRGKGPFITNSIVFLLLFWLIASFIYRDTSMLVYWSLAGFLSGAVNGIALQHISTRFVSLQNTNRRKLFFVIFLIIEFAVGLLLIGPYIWIKSRFIPVSNTHSICCETPMDYGAAHYETVKLKTKDNATIAGWYVEPTTQPGKVIILIHGYGYDRRGTDFQTRILIAAGYGVMPYDLRDHGESEANGSLNSFNRMQTYASDLLQVVNYLKQKSEVKQLGVVGISLGAFATLNSSPGILNNFSGLWMDGLRFENFGAQAQPHNLHDYLKRLFDHQTRWLAGVITSLALPEIIPTITHPKLMLVSSGLDESERSTNEKLIPFLDGNKKLWIIENAWHIGGRFDAADEYREKLLAFFADAFNQ